ncbi:MAG: winged helix-turn-helix transcriptional regulator [Streptosporangiaceae bacterium]
MRSYGQYCSVAKALDVVGDRWTLLIIRELILRGASRYTDLRDGLPGVASNLLAERLRDLEAAGLIRREQAPPPVATTLYHLTDAGAEVRPVLDALGQWGIRYMVQPAGDDQFRSHWIGFPVAEFLRDREPGGPPLSIECRAGTNPAVIEVSGGSVSLRLGPAAAPDVVLDGEPRLVMGLLCGYLGTAEAARLGLRIAGDPAKLERILPDRNSTELAGPDQAGVRPGR